MSEIAVIYVPLSTWVSVNAFTNAARLQRVTITPETGSPTVLTGSGEHNQPMPEGSFHYNTPATSHSPLGYKITVTVESQGPSGAWKPSKVSHGSFGLKLYNLAMVVSEDSEDKDWNDAVVQFNWWTPPE